MGLKIGVVGYGTVGSRVADAVSKQQDMELVGVVKNSPDRGILLAEQRGFDVYALDGSNFKGHKVEGTIEDLIERVDIIVDCSPGGKGIKNKEKYYDGKVPAIYQGGESSGIGTSFNAYTNFEDAAGKKHVRVVSCNTTGLARIIYAVSEAFGVEGVKATLIRRAADPKEYKKGPIDAIIPDPVGISHHAPDLQTVMDVPIVTTAYKVPTTHMHVHDLQIRAKDNVDGLSYLLENTGRIIIADPEMGFKSTSRIMDYAGRFGRGGDLFENVVFGYSIKGKDIYLSQAIHQESIVVPENIDAIRAINGYDKWESIRETDESLGIGSLKMSSPVGAYASPLAQIS